MSPTSLAFLSGDVTLHALFFLSGLTSLVFQILWLRGFSLVLGSTTHAMSCVVTAFLVGLAAGSFGASRALRARRALGRKGARAYGIAELGIGLSGLFVTWVLYRFPDALIRVIATVAPAEGALTLAAHFVAALVLLFAPTFLMGTTLPFLTQALSDKRKLPRLYAMNTLGAAVGSLAASFVLIYYLGCLGSAILVACVNAAIFVVAWRLDGDRQRRSEPSPESFAAGESAPELAAGVALVSGFAVLAGEIAWHRYLSLFLGNRIYVTSVTLFLTLYCLGFAARLVHRWLPRHPARRILAWACAAAVISQALGLVVEGPALRAALEASGALDRIAVAAFLLFSVILPITAMGIVFPVAISLGDKRDPGYGAWLGRIYALNTVAAIVGSLVAGYVLIETIGSNGILALASLSFLVVLWQLSRSRLAVVATAAFALTLPLALRKPRLLPDEVTVAVHEDRHGIFTVMRGVGERLRVFNNNTELVFAYGDPKTQFVQETQAYFPLLFAPKTETLLNVGVGYGITAGALARFPGVKRVDAVEILPALFEEAKLFSGGNYRYHEDVRVRKIVADGRHFLAVSRESYDVISINVTDPYVPGAASLFSSEFYEMAARRLAPGGIFCQHLFGPDLVTLYHGVRAHFPYVKVLAAYENGLTVIGSLEPLRPRQLAVFRKAVDGEPGLFKRIGLASVESFLDLVAEGDGIVADLRSRAPGFVDTDAVPVLEFRHLSGLTSLFRSNH